jgi:hypothetical protein
MKQIICPTDFSTAANNAINYGAQLAKAAAAEFEIFHVQVLSDSHPIASGIMANQTASTTSDSLQKLCEGVSDDYNIHCDYALETTNKTLEKSIGAKAKEGNLVVMGTNGADDLFQYIFGTNTFQTIRKSKCPLLIIPENTNYKPIRRIVFAWDYNPDNKAAISQLTEILEPGAEIIFLHISKEKTAVSDELFKALQDEVCVLLGNKNNILFERIFSNDTDTFASRIDDFVTDGVADALAITFQDRGDLRNIFHGQIVKELSEIAAYPLLVLHI